VSITAALLAVVAVSAQPASVTVDLWNDLAEDITVSAPSGPSAAIPHNKDASFAAPPAAKQLTVRFKGCDYALVFPGALSDFREGGDGPVRVYLSDAIELYIVPPDLILQTPPNFLDPRQPNQFPVYPDKPVCAAPKL
jgi:hypothetical protein